MKRKLIVLLVSVVIIAAAFAAFLFFKSSSKTTNDTTEVKTELDTTTESKKDNLADVEDVETAWGGYSFDFEGMPISLPCTYKEITNVTGYKMKTEDETVTVESDRVMNLNLYDKSDVLVLYIDVFNSSTEDMVSTDCEVVGVWQTRHHVRYGASPITFPGGLQIGQEVTKEHLQELFGEPQETYDYDDGADYVAWAYTYAENPDWTTENLLEVTVVNDLIEEIKLNRAGFED